MHCLKLPPRNEGDPPLIPLFFMSDMITVWIISVVLSVIAGLLPAWKASKVKPHRSVETKNLDDLFGRKSLKDS
jgi:putative ABC transport system permease protein